MDASGYQPRQDEPQENDEILDLSRSIIIVISIAVLVGFAGFFLSTPYR